MDKIRCNWVKNHALAISYHDNEWGVPVHDDNKHFESISLELFQAGLSWDTILNKRENFRTAFDNFDYKKIAKYKETKKSELLENKGIIRHKLKIDSIITNANAFLNIQSKYGSFNNFIWGFTEGKTINNSYKSYTGTPTKSELSNKISKELIKNGFKFVGSTICYSYIQAVGIINDHSVSCFRYLEVKKLSK